MAPFDDRTDGGREAETGSDRRAADTGDGGPTAERDGSGCPKCGNDEATTQRIRTTGSGFASLVEWQNIQFTAVTCDRCGYSEFYNGRNDAAARATFLSGYEASASPDTATVRNDGALSYCGACGRDVEEGAVECSGCGRTFVERA